MAPAAASGRAARVGGVVFGVGAAVVLLAPHRFAPGGGSPSEGPVGTPASIAPAPPAVPVAPVAPVVTGTLRGGPAPTVPAAASPGRDGAAAPGDLTLVELRGDWRNEEDLATAVALAVLVGTAHVTEGGVVRPVIAVEAVEQPGPDAAVVRLLVDVGDAARDALGAARRGTTEQDAPRAVRIAVPLQTGAAGIRPAGTPWRLPGPRLDADPPAGCAVTDPALLEAAADALARAGFDPAALTGLEATDAWPFVARLSDGGDSADGTAQAAVWLRWHLDRFVVTGLPLQPAAGSGQGTGVP